MTTEPEIFEISSDQLAGLYTDLNCDGCGDALTAHPKVAWAKVRCGYFCAKCMAHNVHLGRSCQTLGG